MDSKRATLLVLLDQSAALTQLTMTSYHLSVSFGVKGSALQWFASYLSNRSQRVCFDQKLSEKFQLTCGVPQGSCPYYAITLVRPVFLVLVNSMLLLRYYFGTARVSYSCKFDLVITLLLWYGPCFLFL